MTFAQLYRQCRQMLTDDSADFDLSQLFRAHFNGAPGLCFSEAEAAEEDVFVFKQKVRRLSEGYPLQYLLGEWEFYGIPLKVGPGVLIPQPDTETVADVALELLAPIENAVAADYCAGSGAIALALTKHRPTLRVYAVEYSPEALEYLRQNVAENGFSDRISIVEGDVCGELPLPALDMIVSNPPYLTAEEMKHVPPQVKWEPEMALLGGEDGLDFYRAIAKNAAHQLREGGCLVFEVGYRQANDVRAILQENGYEGISSRRDLCGVERCVYARNPKREEPDGTAKN
jgi:release factor glutamine methyltransferase